MSNLESAKELLVKAAKELPKNTIAKAANNFFKTINADDAFSFSLNNLKVPFKTNDPMVKQIIDEFHLQNPENMIRFMIEWHFAQLEHISENYSDIQKLDLIGSRSFVDGAKRTFKKAIKNPQDKKDLLKQVSVDLDRGAAQLEEKALYYINKVREVDNRGKAAFFFKAAVSVKQIDTYNHCAKAAIEAAKEAMNLQMLIASELDWDISDTIEAFEDFKQSILSGDNCSLMHAYDDEADDKNGFWVTITNKLDNAIDTAGVLTKYIESTDEDDYDNIDFN